MSYKIGFFYNIVTGRSYHDNRFVLTFSKNHFEFKLLDANLLPRNLHLSNMQYYSFDYPVIYEESHNEIIRLIFLDELHLSSDPKNEMGFCISMPTKQLHSASLFLDGKELFPIGEIESFESTETMFYRTVIHFVALRKKMQSIDSYTDIFIDKYIDIIAEIKKYVDSFDINVLLSDLSVSVHDFERNKVGGDNSYYIYKTVSISDERAKNDDYLKRTIGLGEKNIYSDSGYTGFLRHYAEDFIDKHPLGNYTGELLERERRNIISKYSKEEHVGYLVAKYFVDKEFNRKCVLPSWSNAFIVVKNILYEDFALNKISNNNREFEKNMYIFENRYCDVQKELSILNTNIEKLTKYQGKYKCIFDDLEDEATTD